MIDVIVFTAIAVLCFFLSLVAEQWNLRRRLKRKGAH